MALSTAAINNKSIQDVTSIIAYLLFARKETLFSLHFLSLNCLGRYESYLEFDHEIFVISDAFLKFCGFPSLGFRSEAFAL